MKWLHDTPLRDLALHKKYAACIDVKGDVYMWGSAAKDNEAVAFVSPTLILKGRVCNSVGLSCSEPESYITSQDIISLQASESRIIALSSSGKIFSIRTSGGRRSSAAVEAPPSGWNPLNWVLGRRRTVSDDVVELLPADKLRRGEKYAFPFS